jgi:hypothetical protein
MFSDLVLDPGEIRNGPSMRRTFVREDSVRRFFVAAALVCYAVLLAGCQRNDDGATGPAGGSGGGTGTLAVRLMDAPGAYDAVNIVVDSVRVHVESGDSITGWVTLSRVPATYNLLEYVNGRDTIIAEGIIPVGYYSQMRLHIGAGSTVAREGRIYPLETPSGSQSGLKLNIQATIVGGVRYVLLLDFDAERSIVVTGNGRYLLKPVIKTVATAVSGSLTGKVQPDTTRPTVWAIAGQDTSTTSADTTGIFKFRYLAPAAYTLRIVPADTTYRDTTLTGILVSAGLNTDIGTVALQKK